jgi:Chlorophyll A-B binding protein
MKISISLLFTVPCWTSAFISRCDSSTARSSTTNLSVARRFDTVPSQAIPFAECPAVLDGSLAGDVGFDPLCFALDKETLWRYREAEIKHARLAMLAAIGWPLSEWLDPKLASSFDLVPLVDDHNRVPSLLNGGLGKVPTVYWLAVATMGAAVEVYGWTRVKEGDYRPGNLGFDPMGHYKNRGVFRRKLLETAEIKHGRLAMVAVTVYAVQEFLTSDATIHALE